MGPGEPFAFQGTYRVQSKARGKPSRLEGRWGVCEEGELDEATVNQLLVSNPFWSGASRVQLKPAFVIERDGEFAEEPDILYKKSHFVPTCGGSAMPTNIVDVAKAATRWREREPFLVALLGEAVYSQAAKLIGGLEGVVANEYFVHEAGHCLGYDTERKYAQGYFQIAGKIAWPLIYVEEFRADLLSFGFAADLLGEHSAAAVFLYNVLLRLGVHLEGYANGVPNPYGDIPFMLYSLLRKQGWVEPDTAHPGVLCVTSLVPADLIVLMRASVAHCCYWLVQPEWLADTGTDAALGAAHYHKRVLSDHHLVQEFKMICDTVVAGLSADRSSRLATGSEKPD